MITFPASIASRKVSTSPLDSWIRSRALVLLMFSVSSGHGGSLRPGGLRAAGSRQSPSEVGDRERYLLVNRLRGGEGVFEDFQTPRLTVILMPHVKLKQRRRPAKQLLCECSRGSRLVRRFPGHPRDCSGNVAAGLSGGSDRGHGGKRWTRG